MTQACRKQTGFTLIEMLVTLALMALISILAWRALDQTERTSRSLQVSANETLTLARALDQIESDILSHAYFEPFRQTGSNDSGIALATTLPIALQWHDSTLTILRTDASGSLSRTSWLHANNGLQRVTGLLHAAGTAAATEDVSQTALSRIEGFSVRAWIPGHGWMLPDAAPAGIRATGLEVIIRRSERNGAQVYRKVMLLP